MLTDMLTDVQMVVTDVLDGDGDAREESLSLSSSGTRRFPPPEFSEAVEFGQFEPS